MDDALVDEEAGLVLLESGPALPLISMLDENDEETANIYDAVTVVCGPTSSGETLYIGV
jgi:hypothetical protein